MEAEGSLPSVPYDKEAIYTALTQFDESEPEFQAGIQTIIGPMQASGVAPDQIEETKKRAKVFFWSQKTGNQVDYAEYKAWLDTNSIASNGKVSTDAAAASASASASEGEKKEEKEKEPYPASFDAIVELITTGKMDQIPGIRDIPLKVNEEPPTQASMSRPLKPWEKADIPAVELPEPSTRDEAMTAEAASAQTEVARTT